MRITDNEIKEYKIKLEANELINNYNKLQACKKSFNFRYMLLPAMACVLLLLLLPLFIKNDNTNENNMNSEIKIDSLNYELSALASFVDNENINTMSSITLDQYNMIVNKYDEFDTVIYNKYNKINDTAIYEEGQYQGLYDTYSNKIINDNIVTLINYDKSNNNISFTGEMVINQKDTYKLIGSQQYNILKNKTELNAKIFKNDYEYYCVEEHYQINDYSYEFEIKRFNEEVYEFEFEIEDNEIELELEANDYSYEFEILVFDTYWSFEYQYNSFEGEFKLYRENNSKKYIDPINNYEIIK